MTRTAAFTGIILLTVARVTTALDHLDTSAVTNYFKGMLCDYFAEDEIAKRAIQGLAESGNPLLTDHDDALRLTECQITIIDGVGRYTYSTPGGEVKIMNNVENLPGSSVLNKKYFDKFLEAKRHLVNTWGIKKLKEKVGGLETELIEKVKSELAKKQKELAATLDAKRTELEACVKSANEAKTASEEAQKTMETKTLELNKANEKVDATILASTGKLMDNIQDKCSKEILAKLEENMDYNSMKELKTSVKTLKLVVAILGSFLAFVVLVIVIAVIYVCIHHKKDEQADLPAHPMQKRNRNRLNRGPRPMHRPRQRPQVAQPRQRQAKYKGKAGKPNPQRKPRKPRAEVQRQRK